MKKLSLSALALAIGLGAAFFSENPVQAGNHRPSVAWFSYNGSGDVNSASSYTELPGSPSCPTGTTELCAIHATVGTGSEPVMTDALKQEIQNAFDDQQSQPDVDLRN